MKAVEITQAQYLALMSRIKKEYKPSVFLVREKMKATLGFTVRNHTEWTEVSKYGEERKVKYNNKVMLDFYSEKKHTLFLLKYSDILNDPQGPVAYAS